MDYVLCRADERDAQSIAETARDVWTECYRDIITIEQINYMLEKFQSERAILAQMRDGFRYFTAKAADCAIAAYCAVKPDFDNGELFLSKVYVRPNHRKHGLARDLIAIAQRSYDESAFKKISLTVNKQNTTAEKAYKRLGFVRVGQQVADIGGGFVMDDYIMEKNIAP